MAELKAIFQLSRKFALNTKAVVSMKTTPLTIIGGVAHVEGRAVDIMRHLFLGRRLSLTNDRGLSAQWTGANPSCEQQCECWELDVGEIECVSDWLQWQRIARRTTPWLQRLPNLSRSGATLSRWFCILRCVYA